MVQIVILSCYCHFLMYVEPTYTEANLASPEPNNLFTLFLNILSHFITQSRLLIQ